MAMLAWVGWYVKREVTGELGMIARSRSRWGLGDARRGNDEGVKYGNYGRTTYRARHAAKSSFVSELAVLTAALRFAVVMATPPSFSHALSSPPWYR